MEWTNQHGCGGNEDTDAHKLNCNIVMQYMVMDGGVCDPGTELLPHALHILILTSWASFGRLSQTFFSFIINLWIVILKIRCGKKWQISK